MRIVGMGAAQTAIGSGGASCAHTLTKAGIRLAVCVAIADGIIVNVFIVSYEIAIKSGEGSAETFSISIESGQKLRRRQTVA